VVVVVEMVMEKLVKRRDVRGAIESASKRRDPTTTANIADTGNLSVLIGKEQRTKRAITNQTAECTRPLQFYYPAFTNINITTPHKTTTLHTTALHNTSLHNTSLHSTLN
jgi:hypothetical protein